ncbi:MAG: dihydrofolate reductase family protein [Anaerolineae bacterium]|nr:dihydrofolate reductase family protein [Anaerolineae bacterium]
MTLSYAQSLDGCIAAAPGQRTLLSSSQAMQMTHALRAQHDAILVGVGTVIADNPRLNVRLVEGRSPQPIVLDSQLRLPTNAALIQTPVHPLVHPLWVFCTSAAPPHRQNALLTSGTQVFLVNDDHGRVNLSEMLQVCHAQGVRSLMVEGGASVIHAFLQARLVDRVVITLAPRWLSGLPALGTALPHLPQLINPSYQILGPDIVLSADLVWENE